MFADSIVKMCDAMKQVEQTKRDIEGARYALLTALTMEILRIKRLRPDLNLVACATGVKEDTGYILDQLGYLVGRHPITRWKGTEMEKVKTGAVARTTAYFMLFKCAKAALWLYENEGEEVWTLSERGVLKVSDAFLKSMKRKRTA